MYPPISKEEYSTFASTITLNLPPLQKPPPIPCWNFKKAHWHKFTSALETWAESYIPPHDLDTEDQEIVSALHHTANPYMQSSLIYS